MILLLLATYLIFSIFFLIFILLRKLCLLIQYFFLPISIKFYVHYVRFFQFFVTFNFFSIFIIYSLSKKILNLQWGKNTRCTQTSICRFVCERFSFNIRCRLLQRSTFCNAPCFWYRYRKWIENCHRECFWYNSWW